MLTLNPHFYKCPQDYENKLFPINNSLLQINSLLLITVILLGGGKKVNSSSIKTNALFYDIFFAQVFDGEIGIKTNEMTKQSITNQFLTSNLIKFHL